MTSLVPAACDTREGSLAVSAFYIAGRLGHRDRSWPWIRAQIEAMMADGFPPPIPLYLCGPGRPARKAEGLTASTRWHRAAVDAWFDGQPAACVPARFAEAASDALAGHYANDLDARAALIGAGAAR